MRYAPGVLFWAYASKTFPLESKVFSSESYSCVLRLLLRGSVASCRTALATCLNSPSCLEDFVFFFPPDCLFAFARVWAACSAALRSSWKVSVASEVQRSRKLIPPLEDRRRMQTRRRDPDHRSAHARAPAAGHDRPCPSRSRSPRATPRAPAPRGRT